MLDRLSTLQTSASWIHTILHIILQASACVCPVSALVCNVDLSVYRASVLAVGRHPNVVSTATVSMPEQLLTHVMYVELQRQSQVFRSAKASAVRVACMPATGEPFDFLSLAKTKQPPWKPTSMVCGWPGQSKILHHAALLCCSPHTLLV